MTGGGVINQALGPDAALLFGSAALLIVAFVYIVALFGLMRLKTWGAATVIAISIVNRVIAAFMFQFSEAFLFWAVWTTILAVLGFLDYRKLSRKTRTAPIAAT